MQSSVGLVLTFNHLQDQHQFRAWRTNDQSFDKQVGKVECDQEQKFYRKRKAHLVQKGQIPWSGVSLVLGVSLCDFQAQNQCEYCVSESEGGRMFHNYKPLGEKTEVLL